MPQRITDTALLKCNQGATPAPLTVNSQNFYFAENKLVATEYDANAKYTYQAKKTENYLDYAHVDKKQRFSTWYWQWKIANPHVK